tara:strand:- start:254 stop:451 length:198 start_codon:yes stop_codon:yes gene_type:complete
MLGYLEALGAEVLTTKLLVQQAQVPLGKEMQEARDPLAPPIAAAAGVKVLLVVRVTNMAMMVALV